MNNLYVSDLHMISSVFFLLISLVPIHIGDPPEKSTEHPRPHHLHPPQQQRRRRQSPQLLRTPQEIGTHREPPKRKGTHQHRRPCCSHIPARPRLDLRLLRLPLRWRRSGHDPASPPSKPADDITDCADDSGRFEIGFGSVFAACHQAAEVERGQQCGKKFVTLKKSELRRILCRLI